MTQKSEWGRRKRRRTIKQDQVNQIQQSTKDQMVDQNKKQDVRFKTHI